jgi:hypothetical protein
MAMSVCVDSDVALFRWLPLSRRPLGIGELSGLQPGGASCGGRVKASTCALVTHAGGGGGRRHQRLA